MPTIFNKIIMREIPAYIVYEDEVVMAFLDISQATKGHTLLVPKKICADIFELDPDVAAHLFKVAQKLSIALKKAFNAPALNIISNNGEIAGQTVFHFHLHLIPRYEKTDVFIQLSNHMNELSVEYYKERAELIRAALL